MVSEYLITKIVSDTLDDREILCFAGIGAWYKMKSAAQLSLPDPHKALRS
jgi:hypothetical protein